jgi:3-mercaptopyruvate sulfurtransferase SseA
MVAGGVLLIIASVAWMMFSSPFNKTPTSGLAGIQASQPLPSTRVPYPDIQRISVGDAKAALDLKQAIFIDVRGEPSFSTGHIPGALSLTEEQLLSRLDELDPSAWIITYCT